MTEQRTDQTPTEEQIEEAIEELEGVKYAHECLEGVDEEWLECEANSGHYSTAKSWYILSQLPENHPRSAEAEELLEEVDEMETALDQRLEEGEV